MKGLDRYLFRQLGFTMVFVAVALTLAIWLTQSLRYVDYIINRGLSLGTFFYFTMLLTPSLLAIILPIALFIAVTFVYNRLITDRELVVMRTAGMSQFDLATPALILAGLVMVIGYVFNLYLLPVTFRTFKDMETSFRDDIAGVILQEGRFNTLASGLTVYVRTRDKTGELRGILAHDSRKPEKPITYMAQRGALITTPTGPRVVLVKGNRQEVDRKTGRLSILYFERYSVDLSLFRKDHKRSYREPSERFVSELLWPGNSKADRYYAKQLIAQGHQRLASPLLSLAFAIICLAGLLSGEFSRQGHTVRMLVMVVSVATLEGASFGIYSMAAKYPYLIPLIYLNAIVPGAIAWYVLLKDPRRRRPRLRRLRPGGDGGDGTGDGLGGLANA